MAQSATKIFSGPATLVELSPDGSTYTDLGFSSANVEISWEPQKTEIGDQNEFQLSGLGKISVEMIQTDDATLTLVKSYRTQKAYVRITAADGNQYVISGIFLSYSLKRGFKAGEPHTMIVSGQRSTLQPDDFVNFPA